MERGHVCRANEGALYPVREGVMGTVKAELGKSLKYIRRASHPRTKVPVTISRNG